MVIDKKYQIFISSTYIDLVEERKNIIETILKMYHIPIGMEMFSAEDEDQWEIIRRTIDASDYYILVLGLRYGSTTNEGISFTEKEYEYALEKKIPILAFICNENISLEQNKRDDDLTNIKNFRNSVLENSKMADFWKSTDDLTSKVSIALMMQTIQKPAVGWIRGDRGFSEEQSTELTQLSKENRELRNTIKDLETQIIDKRPNIQLSFTDTDLFKVNEEKFHNYGEMSVPNKILREEIEESLQEYITDEEILDYNRKIPTVDKLNTYNKKLEKFYKIKSYSFNLSLLVCNEGTMKANNIYLDIRFPKEIIIFENNKEFIEPKKILPPTPIKCAETRYAKSIEQNSLNRILFNPDTVIMVEPSKFNFQSLNLDKNNWTTLKDNHLTIKMTNLLHTRCRTFDNKYKIVSLDLGTYDVEVKVICEEYNIQETYIVQCEFQGL